MSSPHSPTVQAVLDVRLEPMKRLWSAALTIGALVALISVLAWEEGRPRQAGMPSAAAVQLAAPAEPVGYQGTDIEIEGNLAFVSGQLSPELWAQIVIFDLSNPHTPKQLTVLPGNHDGYWKQTESWSDIDVVGDRLYAFEDHYTWERQGVLHVFDVSIPSAPVELSRIDGFGFPRVVKVSEDNRYLHLRASPLDSGITIYDIDDPLYPEYLLSYATGNCYPIDYKLTRQYNYVMIFDGCMANNGKTSMIVYDVSHILQPTLASNHLLEALTLNVHAFDVAKNYLYIVTRDEFEVCKLKVIDIKKPDRPVQLGEFDICLNYFRVVDGFLYGTVPSNGDILSTKFFVLDIQDPKNIRIVNIYELFWKQNGLEYISRLDVWNNCIIGVASAMNLHIYCQANVGAIPPSPTATSTPSSTGEPTATPTGVTPTPTVTFGTPPTNTPTATVTHESVYLPLLAR